MTGSRDERTKQPHHRSFGLVVPVFDEEQRFRAHGKPLVDFITGQPPGSELVFVDDGSTDGTVALVEELMAAFPGAPVRLLRRPHAGKGGAVAAGLSSVRAHYAGFCDLDLSTPLDQLERVMHAAMRAPVLAVGSRDLAGSKLVRPEGRVREALGRSYNRLLQATITPGVVDTQCGAKVAAREVWARVLPHCRETGFAWDAEAIAVAKAFGVAVQEVPIEWRHDDQTKVHVLRDGAAMVWATHRIWRNVRRNVAPEAAAARRAGGAGRGTAPGTAPATAEVFDDANAELLMEADSDHWWFRSKAAFVATALRRTAPRSGDGRGGWLVDLGAGSGGVTALLGWDPARVMVFEGSEVLVRRAAGRHGLAGCRGVVDRLPLADGTVDVVCLLDVIEHLVDPVPALREAARILTPGGRLVVNVPAHRWLWSEADVSLGHVRRYTRPSLASHLAAAGFGPTLSTHVFSWLVLPVWLKRRMASGVEAELGLDQTSPLLDLAAMVLTRIERATVGRVPIPLGTSVLCVATRPPSGSAVLN